MCGGAGVVVRVTRKLLSGRLVFSNIFQFAFLSSGRPLNVKKNFCFFFEIDLSNRLDLAQIDLNPVFPSKIIDFRLKSITIDGASVNARLTDIIAEYET